MIVKVTAKRLPEGIEITVEGNDQKTSRVLSDFEIKSLISILNTALSTSEFNFTFPLEI